MSNSKYQSFQCHDDRLPTTQEVGIHRCLAFAGIHDASFATWIDEAYDVATSTISDISDMEGAEGTWFTNGGFLYGIGGGAARWYKIRHTRSVDLGFVATFGKTGDRGGFVLNSNSSYECYLVWWTATAVGVSKIDDATETVLVSLPLTETGVAAVTIAVWPKRYSSIDTIDDISVMLWFDDKHLLTHTMELEDYGGAMVGFAVYGSDTITFDGLVVPQLHQLIDWTSVDPGEAASAGYGRVAGHDKVRAQARYDGSVMVWRDPDTDSDWTVPANRPTAASEERQIYPPSHLRLVGALHEIENFRSGTQGHVFAVESDPNALSEEATSARAARRHKQVAEDSHTRTINMAPNPVIEPEDIVTYDNETWRVSVISYQIVREGDNAYVLRSALQLRECL